MRRWNGWGDDTIEYPVPENALVWLVDKLGAGGPQADLSLEQLAAGVPDVPLIAHPLITQDSAERVRHARGHSLPDWVALRTGRIETTPAGVAYPESEDDLQSLFDFARQTGVTLIPYGGGTSVVGHINPAADGPPSVTVDLSRLNDLHHLDEVSRLATFGAGVSGPHLEAALRAQGYTLGHFPQSWEFSTLGGWIATRSSGQQSLHYGRIEDLFAGGRMVAPAGVLDMLPHPASAAGPDLRQAVLGSEGRLGIISQAQVRISPLPERETFHAAFFREWEGAVEAARALVQNRLPLSMIRLSDPDETEAQLTLAGHENLVNLAHRGLGVLGYGRNAKCMLLLAATGSDMAVRRMLDDAVRLIRHHKGFHAGAYMGQKWRASRFLSPYLRNALWDAGYAIDTLETIVPWADVLEAHRAIKASIADAFRAANEPAYVFSHLSHLYRTGASIYTQFLFRVMHDPDRMVEVWRQVKSAASRTIVAHGGTISHQHGVGVDHAPYLPAEKGELGMALIREAAAVCDPGGLLNPGVLFDTSQPAVEAAPQAH